MLQRGRTDGQRTWEKMLHVAHRQRRRFEPPSRRNGRRRSGHGHPVSAGGRGRRRGGRVARGCGRRGTRHGDASERGGRNDLRTRQSASGHWPGGVRNPNAEGYVHPVPGSAVPARQGLAAASAPTAGRRVRTRRASEQGALLGHKKEEISFVPRGMDLEDVVRTGLCQRKTSPT